MTAAESATYDHLRADATKVGGDPAACLILSDWLAERDRHDEAEFWRLLGEEPGIVHGDGFDPDDDGWTVVVTVDLDAFPVDLEPHLPIPYFDPRVKATETRDRLSEMWLSRATACRDLLAAWLLCHP